MNRTWMAAALLAGPLAAAGDRLPLKPNVVFILADDLGYGELGCYGQEKIRTPNLDRLASQGLRLTRHYSGAPVCAPSRCVLLTGRHLGHAEIRGNRQASMSFPNFTEGQHPISKNVPTLAEMFQRAGYATGAMGKWGLGPVGSSGDPNRKGFDHFFGYNCQALAHSYFPIHLWRNGDRVVINSKPVPGHARQPQGPVRMEDWTGDTYASVPILDEAVRFIGAHAGQPFFLYLAFIEPHVAMHPPRDMVESYPEEWDDRPYRGQCGYLPHPRPRAGYAAMITDLDRQVGEVMKALDRAGLADRTLIIFTSDNGPTHDSGADPRFGIGGVDTGFFNSTGGLRGRKGSVYEGGLRVPAIVRWPGRIAAGGVSDYPGYFPDWFPTLCAAAGLTVPAGLDGVNLLPVLTGQGEPPERNPMIWIFPEYGGQMAIQMGTYKMIRAGLSQARPGPWELYDLNADPAEQTHIAASHPEHVERMRRVLGAQWGDNDVFGPDRETSLTP